MMADRTCDICGAIFQYPWKLSRHKDRKTSCAPILEPCDLPADALGDPDLGRKRCHFCGRVFASYVSMRRHVRDACKIAPRDGNEDGMNLLYEHTLRRQQAQIVSQQHQIIALQEMVHKSLGDTTEADVTPWTERPGQVMAVAGYGNQVMQIDQRVHINLNVFGSENIAHIDHTRVREILDSVMGPAGLLPDAAQQAIVKAAMMIYSDPEYPENLTCYLPNKKTSDALVHGQTGWEIQPVQVVAPPMALRGMDILFDKQPLEDSERYSNVMRNLRDNEARYQAGCKEPMKTVLIRNKDLLARVLEKLPISGEK